MIQRRGQATSLPLGKQADMGAASTPRALPAGARAPQTVQDEHHTASQRPTGPAKDEPPASDGLTLTKAWGQEMQGQRVGCGSWRILINESGGSSNSLKPWDIHPLGPACCVPPGGVWTWPTHLLRPQEPRSPGQARTHGVSLPRAIALRRRHRHHYSLSAPYRGNCH